MTETGFDVKVFDDKGESGSIKEDAIDSFCEEFENDEGVKSRIETLERKLVKNPYTPYEIKFNKRTSKQIFLEKARFEVIKGSSVSRQPKSMV